MYKDMLASLEQTYGETAARLFNVQVPGTSDDFTVGNFFTNIEMIFDALIKYTEIANHDEKTIEIITTCSVMPSLMIFSNPPILMGDIAAITTISYIATYALGYMDAIIRQYPYDSV